jgi:hypothetical protein
LAAPASKLLPKVDLERKSIRMNVALGDEINRHSRSARLVVAAAVRPAGGIARPARGEPPVPVSARPVSPVLSGRDQASATPSIAFSPRLASTDAFKDTMPMWQLCDYQYIASLTTSR